MPVKIPALAVVNMLALPQVDNQISKVVWFNL